MKKITVVRVLDTTFDQRTLKSWPLQEWQEHGIETLFLACAPYLQSGAAGPDEVSSHPNLINVTSPKDFEAAVRSLDPGETLALLFLHDYDRRRFAFLRILEQYGIPYGIEVSENGDWPWTFPSPLGLLGDILRPGERRWMAAMRVCWRLLLFPSRRIYKLALDIKELIALWFHPLNWKFLYDHRIASKLGRRKFALLKGPQYWICKSQGSLDYYFPHAYPVGEHTEVVLTHCHVYNEFLKERSNEPDPQEQVVYLDQYLPFLAEKVGVDMPVGPDAYYGKINGLNEFIRDEMNLKMIMTSHPWADFGELEKWTPAIAKQKGISVGPVRNSKFTIGMGSTAVYFAVLYRKPLLFITTNEVEKTYAQWGIQGIADALGKSIINLDEVSPANIDWDAELTVDEERYEYVQHYYIKHPRSLDASTWDIIRQRISTFLAPIDREDSQRQVGIK